MWVWTEDHTAMINLANCLLLVIKHSDVGYGVIAYLDRGDMGTLLKVTDTEEEAKKFINDLGATANTRSSPWPLP